MFPFKLFFLDSLQRCSEAEETHYVDHHDRNHLRGGRGDGGHNERENLDQLVRLVHYGDPRGKILPRACATNQYCR